MDEISKSYIIKKVSISDKTYYKVKKNPISRWYAFWKCFKMQHYAFKEKCGYSKSTLNDMLQICKYSFEIIDCIVFLCMPAYMHMCDCSYMCILSRYSHSQRCGWSSWWPPIISVKFSWVHIWSVAWTFPEVI